jgi:septum formation topological specificity factor MinE
VPITSEEDVEISIASKENTSIMEMSVSLDKKSEAS